MHNYWIKNALMYLAFKLLHCMEQAFLA